MRTVNVAVIGAGWFGDVHSECLIRAQSMIPEVKICLRTIVDINETAAVACMKKYGFSQYTTDWHEVIEDPQIDLVDICVDNKFHKEMALAALDKGKHVFCEKPLSDKLEDARAMEKAADESGLIHMIDFHYRKIPALAQLHALIETGKLGRIYHIKGMFLQDFAFDSPMTWRFKKAQAGGGSIVTMGSHVIDALRFLCGEVDEVCAAGETFIKTRKDENGNSDTCDVDDAMTVLLRFESGALGMIMTSWLSHGCKHHHEIEVYGEKGSAKFNSERLNELELWLDEGDGALNGKRTVLVGRDNLYGELFNLKTGMGIGVKESITIQFRDMIRGITENKFQQPSFLDGRKAAEITSAIIRSADTHSWVKVEN